MALPTDANVDLLLCDAVRQTPDGKLDLAGYFPVAEVKIDAGAKLPVHFNMTFVFVLKDGEGQFRAVMRIIDPLGKELHRYDVPDVKKLAGLHHVMMLPVRLIPFAHAGNYAICLDLDGREYRRSVRIYQ